MECRIREGGWILSLYCQNVTDTIPTIQYIQNPSSNLTPSKNVSTIVQLSYSVPEKDLIKCL